MVAVAPDEKRAVVANAGSGTVTIVPLSAGTTAPKLRHLPIGGTPMGLLFSADGRWLYATNRDANQVVVIDMSSERVVRQIAVPGQPTRLASGPQGRLLFVSTIAGGAVAVVDTKTFMEVARIPVGRRPEGLLVDADGGRGFVSAQDDDKVVEFSLSAQSGWKVLREIKTGAHPDALWLNRSPPLGAADRVDGIDGNPMPLLSPERIAARPATERAEWSRYIERSARLGAADRAIIDAELRAIGRSRMTPAPYSKAFAFRPNQSLDWLRGDEGRRIVDNVLSFQTSSGGWSKHVDVTLHPRNPGESYYSENDGWGYIATIDNDSTTDEMRFLAASFSATGDARVRAAFFRGVSYLLDAQFPNGGWPQVYPLAGGYHDAVTYNDDAVINVLSLLGEIDAGGFAFVTPDLRKRARAAVARGLACILATQIVERGARSVWAQQHDPLTLAPVSARSYELAGLAGRESAAVTKYLMSLPSPSPAVVESVHAAATWFRDNGIRDFEYDVKTGLKTVTGAGPIWARLYEPETGRPIFSNRDGIKHYNWNELSDRRFGYTWFGKEPAAVLSDYRSWANHHPRVVSVPDKRP